MTKSSRTPKWHTGDAVSTLLSESNRAKAAAALGMGTTVTTMYRWLKEPEWPQRNIDKASAYFGVSAEWLMTGHGPKYVAQSGGNDPRDAQVEVLLIRMEAEVKRLLQQYTKKVAQIYAPKDANTPPAPKGKQREWTTRPTENPLD